MITRTPRRIFPMNDFVLKMRRALRVDRIGLLAHPHLRLIGFHVLKASTPAPQLLRGKLFKGVIFVDGLRLTQRAPDGASALRFRRVWQCFVP